jgi:hypothetical protein
MLDLIISIFCESYHDTATALLVGWSRDRFPVVSQGIFSVAPDGTMCPGIDSASEIDYQGFLVG